MKLDKDIVEYELTQKIEFAQVCNHMKHNFVTKRVLKSLKYVISPLLMRVPRIPPPRRN